MKTANEHYYSPKKKKKGEKMSRGNCYHLPPGTVLEGSRQRTPSSEVHRLSPFEITLFTSLMNLINLSKIHFYHSMSRILPSTMLSCFRI